MRSMLTERCSANERKSWRCAGPCWAPRKLSANPVQMPRAAAIQPPRNSPADARFAKPAGSSAFNSSLPRHAPAYRRPCSQTPNDHHEHTVNQVADQLVGPPKGIRKSLSEAVVLALQKRSRRLLPTKSIPSKWRVTISTTQPYRRKTFFRTSVDRTVIQYP